MVAEVTSIALPLHSLTSEQARDFARVLCYRMGLSRAEWLALVNAPMAWARAMCERGVYWPRTWGAGSGEVIPVPGFEGPTAVTVSPELAVNTMMRTALWISALRGDVAKRGSLVCFQCSGRVVFGRVIRKNTDGTLRIVLEDGQASFFKFTSGIYNGRTICSWPVDLCAVLAR